MFRKITYTDKEDILGLVSIDNKNKVTAQDMNDIKNAINDNTQELDRIMVHLAGDTMTGALNFKANTWNKYGSNVAVGAINTAGTLAVKGLDGKTTIRLVPNGATDNNGVTWTANSATDSTISGTLNGSFKGPLEGNAATTTKLQTARTINDTSFNGTANITTAKWGTARDITLGLTKKSVNGSTNMAWTLAEIGALPAAGGTMTGDIEFAKITTGVRGIKGNLGSTDAWRIVGSTNASNDSYLEIATTNGGNEPIYIRQYTSTTAGSFGTVARTATILDASGNTTLPGLLTVNGIHSSKACTFDDNLTVKKNITGNGTLSIDGVTTLKNNANINGTLSVDGATTFNADGTFKKNAVVNGTLSVDGATTLKKTLEVTGATSLKNNATVGGTLSVDGATTLKNTLGVTGATTLGSTLSVTGIATLKNDTNINGALSVDKATTLKNTLNVTGITTLKNNAIINGTLSVDGATSLKSTLGVTGATTLNDTLDVTKATTLKDTLGITGATTLGSTLGVTGATSLKSTLNVTGATTLGSTLNVTGIATLKNNAIINGTLSVDGATSLKSTLGVTGATTLSNTLTVSGITNLNNALNVTGATALKSTLGVTGVATFNDNSSFKKNINIDGVLNSSLTTGTHLQGNQGKAIINSTATAGSYTMLAKMNSTNGYFTTGTYNGGYLLQYTAKSTVDAGTNAVTKSVTLLDESGNATFPERVTAKEFYGTFIGNSSTVTKLQTARKINDTSFDGTADITTTKWGTARNIYIADSDATNTGAAVSVNGSGNATLKLPATIKASLTGNASTASALQDYNSTSNTIQIGYSGSSLTSSEVAYLAAYKSGGKQIKDVSVSTVKTLMGIKNSKLNVTCSSSNWSGSAAPYTNTINVTGVTASNIVEVGLNNASATDAQVQACMKASIAKITQENGKIKLYAYGTKPTVNIPMTVVILTT